MEFQGPGDSPRAALAKERDVHLHVLSALILERSKSRPELVRHGMPPNSINLENRVYFQTLAK